MSRDEQAICSKPSTSGTLFQAGGDAPALQEAVAQLCVAWWQAGALAKEDLITQTLPYVVVRALMTGKQGSNLFTYQYRCTVCSLFGMELPQVLEYSRAQTAQGGSLMADLLKCTEAALLLP